MLSLIVLCSHDAAATEAEQSRAAEATVRTLSAFVGATVRGLVREAVLAGPSHVKLGYIADHAGCAVVESKSEAEGLAAALQLTRAAHLLMVRAGYIPEAGFAEAVEDLLRFGKTETHGWLLRGEATRPIEKLLPRLVRPAALLAPRQLCLASKATSFAALGKATHAKPAAQIRLRCAA